MLTSKGGLKPKGKYWQAHENWHAAQKRQQWLSPPRLHSRAVGGLASSRTEQKNSGKCEMQAKGGKFIQRGKMEARGVMQLHLTWGSGSYHLATTWWIMSNCNYSKNTKCGIEVEKSADHCTGGGLHADPKKFLPKELRHVKKYGSFLNISSW